MNAKQRFIKQCKEKFYECYKKLDGKDVVLFAAGGRAHMMVLAFKEMGIKEYPGHISTTITRK